MAAGRALDNVFVERLWRTVKYEEVYLKSYETVPIAIRSLGEYFRFYNEERLAPGAGVSDPGRGLSRSGRYPRRGSGRRRQQQPAAPARFNFFRPSRLS